MEFVFQIGSAATGKDDGVGKSHVVELSALTTRGDEAVADDLRILADQLKPLVSLQNFDYRRM